MGPAGQIGLAVRPFKRPVHYFLYGLAGPAEAQLNEPIPQQGPTGIVLPAAGFSRGQGGDIYHLNIPSQLSNRLSRVMFFSHLPER